MKKDKYGYHKDKINKDNKKEEYTYIFKVKRSTELLAFLLEKMNTSRNNVKKILSEHKVSVNGKVVTQFNMPLANEDEIKILKYSQNVTKEAKKKEKLDIDIIYEDDDFIAINKPNGLLSVESDNDTNSAFSKVLDYLSSKDKTLRPYTIHRIDKETSGVLVFSKSPIIQSKLRLNWNKYVRTREYYAVIKGHLDKDMDRIILNMKEGVGNLMFVNPSGDKTITDYKVIAKNEAYSLLKVLISTGKKNQIRVALSHLGHPILGDDKYGDSDNTRLFLHASCLEFINPNDNNLISIRAKVPNNFRDFFNK
jgi:RluA family pseudouridine synthase